MKQLKILTVCLLCSGVFSSCATIFGGTVDTCQRTKPANASRPIRVVALIADIVIFWPSLIVDFATNAIYVPCSPHGSHVNVNVNL